MRSSLSSLTLCLLAVTVSVASCNAGAAKDSAEAGSGEAAPSGEAVPSGEDELPVKPCLPAKPCPPAMSAWERETSLQ